MRDKFKLSNLHVRRWFVGAVLLGLALVMISALVLAVIIVSYGNEDRAHPADVIVVLGGGRAGTARRARHAAVLYAEGYADKVICTGGKLPRAHDGEAEWCARVLQKRGVPASAIILEANSRSTEENGIEVAHLMRANGWQDAVLVSDDYHLWRARWMFERQGVKVWPSPAQITDHSLTLRDEAVAVTREILALGWFVGKSLIGVKETHSSF